MLKTVRWACLLFGLLIPLFFLSLVPIESHKFIPVPLWHYLGPNTKLQISGGDSWFSAVPTLNKVQTKWQSVSRRLKQKAPFGPYPPPPKETEWDPFPNRIWTTVMAYRTMQNAMETLHKPVKTSTLTQHQGQATHHVTTKYPSCDQVISGGPLGGGGCPPTTTTTRAWLH